MGLERGRVRRFRFVCASLGVGVLAGDVIDVRSFEWVFVKRDLFFLVYKYVFFKVDIYV